MSPTGFLESWLAPLDVEAFRDEFLARRSLYREGSRERVAPLLALRKWDAIDLLSAQTKDVLAWFTATDGRHLTAEVSPEAARKLYQGGTTIYIKEPPELAPVRESVARSLHLPSDTPQCNLFCNQPGATTRAHFDPVDTITIQLTGQKRWRIAPNRHLPDPTLAWATLDRSMRPEMRLYARGPMPDEMPPGEVEEYLLEPGAVLYVPRGFWHETESAEPSISLHVHLPPLTWVDAVLVALRGKLLRDPAFRASAWNLWDPARRPAEEAKLGAMLASVATAAADLAPDDVLATPRPSVGEIDPAATVTRRALTGIFVEKTNGEGALARVTFTSNEQGGTERRTTVEMSEAYLRACDLFAGAAPPPLSARDLAARVPNLSADEALGLVKLLLDVGFLRPASLAPSPRAHRAASARFGPPGAAAFVNQANRHAGQSGDELGLGGRMGRGVDGAEDATAGQRERNEQLVGQVLADRHAAGFVGESLGGGALGDGLGGQPALADDADELGHVLALDLDE